MYGTGDDERFTSSARQSPAQAVTNLSSVTSVTAAAVPWLLPLPRRIEK